MTTTQALKTFTAHAQTQGLDLSGDALRFYTLKTARAWTAFHAAHCKAGGAVAAAE